MGSSDTLGESSRSFSEKTPGGRRPPSPPEGSPLTKFRRGTAAVRRTSIVAARMLQVERTPSELERQREREREAAERREEREREAAEREREAAERERQAAEDKLLSENLGLGGKERKQIEKQFRRRKAVFKLRQFVNDRYNSKGANPLFAERDYIYEAPEMRAARRLHSSGGPRRRRTSVSGFLRYRLSHSNPRIPIGYLPQGRRDALRESMRGGGAAEAGVWLASVEISPSQILLQDGPGNMGFFVQVAGACPNQTLPIRPGPSPRPPAPQLQSPLAPPLAVPRGLPIPTAQPNPNPNP